VLFFLQIKWFIFAFIEMFFGCENKGGFFCLHGHLQFVECSLLVGAALHIAIFSFRLNHGTFRSNGTYVRLSHGIFRLSEGHFRTNGEVFRLKRFFYTPQDSSHVFKNRYLRL
jgi:hypothetical protein